MPSGAWRSPKRHCGSASSGMPWRAGRLPIGSCLPLIASRDARWRLARRSRKAPVIAPHQRRSLGNITALLAILDDFPELAPAVGLIDVNGDIPTLLPVLPQISARIYLRTPPSYMP